MSQAVLLLDYEPRTAVRIAEALSSLGCEVITAKDVDAAVAACAKVEPKIVLTTSVLPRLKVEDAITQLRARAGLRHTPFLVMMSGYNGHDPKADATKLGAQDIVAKPFSNEELAAHVAALLSHPRAEATVNPDTRAEMLEALRRGAASAKVGGTVTSNDLFGDLLAEEQGGSPADTQRIAIPSPALPPNQLPPVKPVPPPKPPAHAGTAGSGADQAVADTLAELGRSAPKPTRPRETGTDTAVEKLLSDTLSGLDLGGLHGKTTRPAVAPEQPAPPRPAQPTTPTTPEPTRPYAVVTKGAPPLPPKSPVTGAEVEKGPGPLPGGTPFGQYELIEPIATGGMAEVYRARMKGVEGFQKIVAIKRILAHLTDNDEFVTMFVDEAKLAAQLQHPNIIHIYDLGKIERSYYIAMEYIDGKDLRSILRTLEEKKSRLPLGLALFIGSRLAAALDYAHRKKDLQGTAMALVHRDVSPQNVLISYDGDIKLCDFGIAKAASKASHTRAGALKGKLQYMSPEQAWGRDIDHRSDIFSLGLVLYEMLTGRKGFAGDSELSILEQVRAPRLVPPRDIDPSIPPEVERVVLKALKENREDRYQTAADLASDLVSILQSIRPAPGAPELGAFLADLVGRERPASTATAPAARPAPPPPVVPLKPPPVPAEPPKPKPTPRIPVMEPVREGTPADLHAPSGIRLAPVAAVVIAVLAIVAAVLLLTRAKRPAEAPTAEGTPVPETVQMAREVAQQEVAKQTQALREKLAGEILAPAAQARPAAPAAVRPTAAAVQRQQPPPAQPAANPPAQQAAAQAPPQVQPAAPQATAAPAAAAPEPTTAPPATEPTAAPPTPAPVVAAPAAAPPQAPAQAPVQVGDVVEPGPDVIPPQAISRTPPTYPALAARQRQTGAVTMDVLVDENGNVEDVKVVKGIRPDFGLDAAAVSAVRTWRFRPATKNGVRVKVHISLTTTFKL
ncbi:MAG: TonB family protein [Acidobacteriia bacterium]|nr:TonB family protein [Terriglobia bacterium]